MDAPTPSRRARNCRPATHATGTCCVTWPFAANAPDQIWVGDITHLPTREALLFAVLIDAHRRRIVGWAMDDHQRL